jgi:predicted Na+-dependent transporter
MRIANGPNAASITETFQRRQARHKMCAVLFTSGWVIGMLLSLGRDQQISLMYGVGVTNNGTGLVLASTGLSGFPQVLLPILLYNLAQHVVAGVAQRWIATRQHVARLVQRGAPAPTTSARV